MTPLPSFSQGNCTLRLAGQSLLTEAVGMKQSPEQKKERDRLPKQVEHKPMGANEVLAELTKVDVRLLLLKRFHVMKGGL